MNKIVVVYNNRAYDVMKLVVNVEEIETPPQNGCRVFTPGVITYSFTLPDFTNILTTEKPYRFIDDDKLFFVFHTI